MPPLPSLQDLLEAIDEPALIVSSRRVAAANAAARALLGHGIEGGDMRLAIRHPAAIEQIASGADADLEVTGIAGAERPWLLSIRALAPELALVRLVDRSGLRSAEKMRVDFVANASHELRTPLTTILGYAETIAEDGALDPAIHAKFGGIIRSEARRMLRIVEDLMSLSRIEADRFRPPRETVSVEEAAELAAAHGRELAGSRDCAIAVEVEPGLPPLAGDLAQILQMLDNLVSNAIRYGCTSRRCTVRIAARAEGPFVVLTVSDDGEGIDPEHLPRLTERFYRVDATRSRDSGGTGLGLAIVKHIVERHRGSLQIRSQRGRGTEVAVRLPAAGDAVTKV